MNLDNSESSNSPSTNSYLGSRSIESIHERAIRLWIHEKHRDFNSNPTEAVFFVLTDESWPENEPLPGNAIDLCSALNAFFNIPPMTEDEILALNAKALLLLREHKSWTGPHRLFQLLTWANRAVYFIAWLSFWTSGWSWWVGGLMVAVWWCFGAAKTAASMKVREPRPKWELLFIATLHLISLFALAVTSLYHLNIAG